MLLLVLLATFVDSQWPLVKRFREQHHQLLRFPALGQGDDECMYAKIGSDTPAGDRMAVRGDR